MATNLRQETKFKSRIDGELLSAMNRIVDLRGISISAFATEIWERVLREEAGKGTVQKRVVGRTIKGAPSEGGRDKIMSDRREWAGRRDLAGLRLA